MLHPTPSSRASAASCPLGHCKGWSHTKGERERRAARGQRGVGVGVGVGVYVGVGVGGWVASLSLCGSTAACTVGAGTGRVHRDAQGWGDTNARATPTRPRRSTCVHAYVRQYNLRRLPRLPTPLLHEGARASARVGRRVHQRRTRACALTRAQAAGRTPGAHRQTRVGAGGCTKGTRARVR